MIIKLIINLISRENIPLSFKNIKKRISEKIIILLELRHYKKKYHLPPKQFIPNSFFNKLN